jgi:transcriptional regulator with XRE-family HTH domain
MIRDMAAVGARIKGLREAHRLEQIDLADAAGMSRAYISRLENGGILNPKVHDLSRVAAVLGTSLSYLLGEEAGGAAIRAALTPVLGPQQAELLEDVVEEIRDWSPEDQAFIVDLISSQTFNWPHRRRGTERGSASERGPERAPRRTTSQLQAGRPEAN